MVSLSGARITVTGAAGFLGANLVRALLGAGAEVTAIVRSSTDRWRLRAIEDRIHVLAAELAELPGHPGLPQADIVYHLASAGVDQRMQDVPAMIEANVSGTFAVLEMARDLGAGRMVHIGSSGEYGAGEAWREDHPPAPISEYGATKAAGTILAEAFSRRTGLPLVVLRPFSVFGPWEAAYRLVPHCILRALDGENVRITAGSQTRDFVFVDDVMRACVAAGAAPDAVGQICNVCTGISTPVRDLAALIVDACGTGVELDATRPHEANELWATSGNPDRARHILGWEATTPLEEGIRATVDWFRRERQAYRDAYS